MEDILAILLIFGGGTAVAMSFSPVGRALAERLRGKNPDALPSEDVEELREHIQSLQQQVSELAERQDFAERMLAQQRDKIGLPPARDTATPS